MPILLSGPYWLSILSSIASDPLPDIGLRRARGTISEGTLMQFVRGNIKFVNIVGYLNLIDSSQYLQNKKGAI